MSSRADLEGMNPTVEQLNQEIERLKYRHRYRNTLGKTLFVLAAVAVFAILLAILLPVVRITGDSMANTLQRGDIIIALRDAKPECGALVVLNVGGKTMVKRLVARAGDELNILDDGTVQINGVSHEEEYIINKALGQCDIEMPYVVPEARYFVMGDNREISLDSRSEAIGCVAEEQIIGKVMLRVWPLNRIGLITYNRQANWEE